MIASEKNLINSKKSDKSFYLYTIFLFLSAFVISITVDKIENVFNIVGAIAANSVSFLFPTLFYFMMVRKTNTKKGIYYYAAVSIFVFFIPFGVFMIISNYL